MLILLPPSEGKALPPRRGGAVDLAGLSFPDLASTRTRILDELVAVCSGDPDRARQILGLPPGLVAEVIRNRTLATTPAVRVTDLYTGVLFDTLGLSTLDLAARRRAGRALLVFSGLWGVLRLVDKVPPYRLAGQVALPGTGPLPALWRPALAAALVPATAHGLVLDLRSTVYASMWRPTGGAAGRTVTVRVLHERRAGDPGSRVVASHFNKATKGRLVRALLASGATPGTVPRLVEVLRGLGYHVSAGCGRTPSLDVIVTEV